MCLFLSFLADSIQHSSIKVYLSAIRSLHIQQGLSELFLNCLRLQRVVRGIKRSQGCPVESLLPITDGIMMVIWTVPERHLTIIACSRQPVYWATLDPCSLLNSLSLT